MPEPVTSVRSPQTAPAPKLNCMSYNPSQEPLQPFLSGVSDIPSLRIARDCRAWEMIRPPVFDQLFDRNRVGGFDYAEIFLGHGHSFENTGQGRSSPRGQKLCPQTPRTATGMIAIA